MAESRASASHRAPAGSGAPPFNFKHAITEMVRRNGSDLLLKVGRVITSYSIHYTKLYDFGANRLPEAGRAVGKGIREFQRALRDTRDEIERPEAPRPAPPRDAAPKRLVE